MKRSFRVAYYLRSLKSKDGTNAVLIRLCLDSERLFLGSSGYNVDARRWNSNLGRLNSNRSEDKYINRKLDEIELELEDLFDKLNKSGMASLEMVKQSYKRGKGVRKDSSVQDSFFSFMDSYIESLKEEIGIRLREKAYSRYKNTAVYFKNFIFTKYMKSDLSMFELTPEIITNFRIYLTKDQNLHQNTVMKKLQIIKTITTQALKKGFLKVDPFCEFKFHYKASNREYLTEDELDVLMDKDFGIERLNFARDLFIFSCFTGLAYIDVFNLSQSNITIIDGKPWIMTHRKKTEVPTRILLLDIPRKILIKYAGTSFHDKIFPLVSDQKINSYLKEIAVLCRIKKHLTFHVARHTFATLALSKGVPVESLSKMLGHTDIKTTQIYAKIINKKIEEDMMSLSEKLGMKTLAGEEDDLSLSPRRRRSAKAELQSSLDNNDDKTTSFKELLQRTSFKGRKKE